MDPAERELFARGVDDAVSRAPGAVDPALEALGWADALALDDRLAVSVLFEAQGRAGATSGALDLVLSRALGDAPAPVLLPPFGGTDLPGRIDAGAVSVAGLATAAAGAAGPLHVACADERGPLLATVEVEGLVRRPVGGIDPDLGLVEVHGTASRASTRTSPEVAWDDVVAAGQRALAHELVGASAAMLELARLHALERIQFGVPISSFQAVRHRLADSLVALESARGALDAAWDAGTAFDAAVAKAIAGRSARLVARHAQQVLAGIGFTLEHPLHRHLRRVRVLDGLFGDSRTLTRRLGAHLLEARGLPEILPL